MALIQDIVPIKKWVPKDNNFYHNLNKWPSSLSDKNKVSFTTILGVE